MASFFSYTQKVREISPSLRECVPQLSGQGLRVKYTDLFG